MFHSTLERVILKYCRNAADIILRHLLRTKAGYVYLAYLPCGPFQNDLQRDV